ncbi:MAG TPA: hypothetical protein PKD10_03335 [Paracoccaceae bacterium]|nr:hypothetical protein [Paracoccaceae bacterium]
MSNRKPPWPETLWAKPMVWVRAASGVTLTSMACPRQSIGPGVTDRLPQSIPSASRGPAGDPPALDHVLASGLHRRRVAVAEAQVGQDGRAGRGLCANLARGKAQARELPDHGRGAADRVAAVDVGLDPPHGRPGFGRATQAGSIASRPFSIARDRPSRSGRSPAPDPAPDTIGTEAPSGADFLRGRILSCRSA